ncbi:unnamed protein product [Schistosoma mattheei]|uniref:Uncharacterized protein n=1 Tax=Schistosoma mattheei TaxID=31246 RepID=A0A183PCY7_9TREM|nr:unnamed protein product [Schistosoma mattheei]
MNTENKSKLTLSNCVCDICQCFNNKLENKQYTHVKCKLNDKVKLWNRYEGIVKFIGPIHFKSNVSVILVGIELNSHISRITLNNYNLYCDQMKRILVPTTFFTLLSPGQRGYPQIKVNLFGINSSTLHNSNHYVLRMPGHRLPRHAMLTSVGNGWKKVRGGQTKMWH